jgi:hypothetical protein
MDAQGCGGASSSVRPHALHPPGPLRPLALLSAAARMGEPSTSMYGPVEGLPELRDALRAKVETVNLLHGVSSMRGIGAACFVPASEAPPVQPRQRGTGAHDRLLALPRSFLDPT